MILERRGDMMRQPRSKVFPLLVTTNSSVKKNGDAVMGRGIARQVRDLHPSFAADLGELLTLYGNRPFRVREDIWSFPVKKDWRKPADMWLIRRSFEELVPMVFKFGVQGFHLPRPGCGNGGLDWKEVRPLVEEFSSGLPDLVIHVWDY